MENERRFPLATTAVFFFALAGAARAFAAHTDDYSSAYPDNVTFPLTLSYPAGGKPQVLRLDFGEASTGGYAVFDVASAKGCPVMRVAYATLRSTSPRFPATSTATRSTASAARDVLSRLSSRVSSVMRAFSSTRPVPR